jgi:tetratricopeptide (TPR) repeat protein
MRFSQTFLLWLFASSAVFAAPISIDVLDATVKDKRLSGASVLLQQSGEQTVRATTDANGKAKLNSSKAENADTMLIIKKEGFSDLVVKCPCNGLTYALSPVMQNLDGLRIVLSWGAQPLDLDAHLVYADTHIYFDQKEGGGALLDVDDTDSYGPETITIDTKKYGTEYIYAVHDFSDRGAKDNERLSSSGAKVFVYIGQSLVKTYSVPTDEFGTVWTVFRLNAKGDFEDINRMSYIPLYDTDLYTQLAEHIKQIANEPTRTASSALDPDVLSRAEELNKLGEKKYHSGDIEASVLYYSEAIRLNEYYAQAWSNLGLSYQKLNMHAECVYANRKAIEYASGEDKDTIRAASYYNIGRLYEYSGKEHHDLNYRYNEALRYYQYAIEQKYNSVYDTAIKRVKGKLNRSAAPLFLERE